VKSAHPIEAVGSSRVPASRDPGTPIRIILADDHSIVRQGLALLLDGAGFEVIGEAADGGEAVQLACELEPDVAVLDVVMPHLNGLDAARQIHAACPRTRTILLTGRQDEQLVLEALQIGVRGCVLKTHDAHDLIQAVRDVAAGGVYLSASMSHSVAEAYRTQTRLPPDPLSPRERQVLQLIAEGQRTREIARLLGVSVKTAETHRTNIMRKLGIRQTAGLVRYALKHGFSEL
jgi:two-component system, NarL family, response regulator NreC